MSEKNLSNYRKAELLKILNFFAKDLRIYVTFRINEVKKEIILSQKEKIRECPFIC